jgi:hypothetical protein
MTDRQEDPPWMGPLPAASGCACHICRPDESYDSQDRNAIETVLRHGWQVMAVSDDHGCEHPEHADGLAQDHGESSPGFAYTIGLGHRRGHPELPMSGLDRSLMDSALNNVAERVMSSLQLSPGDVLEDVLAGVPVVLEQVADDALTETVTWSGWFHRRKPAALVIVWPSTSGLFAWQPGAPAVLDEAQPRRWRVPIRHTGGVAVDPAWPFPVPPELRAFSCTHVVDDGAAVLWAARESDPPRGEDWSVHCGALGHDTEEMRVVHLAHLVRAAPSLRALSALGLDEEAFRTSPDSPWTTAALA